MGRRCHKGLCFVPSVTMVCVCVLKLDCFAVIAGPPTIIQGETTQTVNVDEGENTTLRCAATGYPTPNISWVRVNGNPLPPPYNRYAVEVFVLFFHCIKLVSEIRLKCFS